MAGNERITSYECYTQYSYWNWNSENETETHIADKNQTKTLQHTGKKNNHNYNNDKIRTPTDQQLEQLIGNQNCNFWMIDSEWLDLQMKSNRSMELRVYLHYQQAGHTLFGGKILHRNAVNLFYNISWF